MIRVFDRERRFFAGSVEDNAADPLLAVAERVLPNNEIQSISRRRRRPRHAHGVDRRSP
jgi:hypothetical protein